MSETETPAPENHAVGSEPTDHMLNEGQERLCQISSRTDFNDYQQAEIYKAMRAVDPTYAKLAEPVRSEGWNGNKCSHCKGHGLRSDGYGEERRCPECAGTGDEYGSAFPKGFFDDNFDKPSETDTPLQSAAREAGWALSTLVDEIKFEKRGQVVNIINALSAALTDMDRRTGHGNYFA